jgi:hypothetical protein
MYSFRLEEEYDIYIFRKLNSGKLSQSVAKFSVPGWGIKSTISPSKGLRMGPHGLGGGCLQHLC